MLLGFFSINIVYLLNINEKNSVICFQKLRNLNLERAFIQFQTHQISWGFHPELLDIGRKKSGMKGWLKKVTVNTPGEKEKIKRLIFTP